MTTTPTSEIATYRGLFDERYAEMEELLAGLPNEALLWKPFEQSPWKGECNSIGKIAAHAVSSTVYLLRRAEYAIGQRAWDTVDGDEGSEEFGPANHDLSYLQARVRRTHDYVNQFLDSIHDADLAATRPHPERSRTFEARHDVVHAIDHLSQHIGHGQITRQLWALQASKTPAARKTKTSPVDNSPVYQLKVTLRDIRPPIWRRVQVRGSSSLADLHLIIQAAMGWENAHLHQYVVRGKYYGEPDIDEWGWGPEVNDEADARLEQIAPTEGKSFTYEYDFGDSWKHSVLVEKILPVDPAVRYPVCVTGRRACPPEDVGGVWGYAGFLEALGDPAHPAHGEWLEWVDGTFDPQAFDPEEINARLGQIAPYLEGT